ncbi:uncharacterized protein LOC131056460 isoform X1 [Cryptomeria japonica]|uniref:uncharacterized protein LOC131056460 isoform X1 n=1 Tax=Cryptomeria japonica TaxID=3369 RepID=UPI0027DA33EF|nr:uncharacterized protein LOC131056460 isoform X1 [Cryptomeria japonica]
MVVCKCKKATKLYCFVHKAPVCGECICFPEHQLCVIRTYSEWVIDGDYDWPPNCSVCQKVLEDGAVTTRLGCLHVVHTHCMVSHLESFPPHTAPAGYVCPACSSPVWPPKSIREPGSALHTKLKEAISQQSELAKNLLGNDLSAGKSYEPRAAPPAFASGPLVNMAAASSQGNASVKETNALGDSSLSGTRSGTSISLSSDIVEIDGDIPVGLQSALTPDPQFSKSPNTAGPGATTRKGSYRGDKYNPTFSTYDDDDESKRKYTRRGGFHRKFLRVLLPFWSPALSTLPITTPRKEDRDGLATDELIEGHSRRRRSTVDPRRILLFIAILSCMATMMLLYYRLSQSSTDEDRPDLEQQ